MFYVLGFVIWIMCRKMVICARYSYRKQFTFVYCGSQLMENVCYCKCWRRSNRYQLYDQMDNWFYYHFVSIGELFCISTKFAFRLQMLPGGCAINFSNVCNAFISINPYIECFDTLIVDVTKTRTKSCIKHITLVSIPHSIV